MGATAVAAVLIRERHIVGAFKHAGATSAETARAPEELSVGVHGLGWRRLRERAIVREAANGRFYVDLPSWEASRRLRHRRVLILAVLIAAFALWYYGPWR